MDPEKASFSISGNLEKLQIGNDGFTEVYSIKSNTEWKFVNETDQSWVTVSPTKFPEIEKEAFSGSIEQDINNIGNIEKKNVTRNFLLYVFIDIYIILLNIKLKTINHAPLNCKESIVSLHWLYQYVLYKVRL